MKLYSWEKPLVKEFIKKLREKRKKKVLKEKINGRKNKKDTTKHIENDKK